MKQNQMIQLDQPAYTVRYDATQAEHTTQFVLSASDEAVLLECSSGLVREGDDVPQLPIHTRLALPWSAARHLHQLLGQLLQGEATRHGTYAADEPSPAGARLPALEATHA